MQNAKAYYKDNEEEAEITYSWFSDKIKDMYLEQGKDTAFLFKSGAHYLINPERRVFRQMLKRQ